jgi:hypothetical protein
MGAKSQTFLTMAAGIGCTGAMVALLKRYGASLIKRSYLLVPWAVRTSEDSTLHARCG